MHKINDLAVTFSLLYCSKQIHYVFPWVYSARDHRRRQNVVRMSVKHSTMACVPLFCFYNSLTLSVIFYCRCLVKWNLFVNYQGEIDIPIISSFKVWPNIRAI